VKPNALDTACYAMYHLILMSSVDKGFKAVVSAFTMHYSMIKYKYSSCCIRVLNSSAANVTNTTKYSCISASWTTAAISCMSTTAAAHHDHISINVCTVAHSVPASLAHVHCTAA
jgi:hypothetical protein